MTNKGRQWYNNGEINKMFSPDDFIPEGFIKGKIQKEIDAPIKGRKAYTDGNSVIFLMPGDVIPEGFHQGTSDKQREHLKEISNNNKGVLHSEEHCTYCVLDNSIERRTDQRSCSAI